MPNRESAAEICPVETTLAVIGGKWKPVILWRLSEGALRSAQLKAAIPGITQRVFTHQLRELEADGVIAREVVAGAPPAVTYRLTVLGESLGPVLAVMSDWGKAHPDLGRATSDASSK
ncbi:MAG: helix-turn-helix transcriptional regulator [Myxococcales bacterium]|nr:helix-turn-helix transcriptional regulator [Myxococcales bacterium]MCB9734680.1 helix-turn-helix transcriptional regulator [Deltaproteobacteria bacterium]